MTHCSVAGKDFDLLILPGQNHAFKGRAKDYFNRKRWDYFVRNLLGGEPPAGYRIGDDAGTAGPDE